MQDIKAHKAKNLKEKVKGLIGENTTQPFYLETRFGIHTFGVKKPLDIIILDSQNRVVQSKKSLLPNRIFMWNPKFYKVIELPEGTIEKGKIKCGEKINVVFENLVTQ